jgi:hypothetical protein
VPDAAAIQKKSGWIFRFRPLFDTSVGFPFG